jgi:hypothetical protein
MKVEVCKNREKLCKLEMPFFALSPCSPFSVKCMKSWYVFYLLLYIWMFSFTLQGCTVFCKVARRLQKWGRTAGYEKLAINYTSTNTPSWPLCAFLGRPNNGLEVHFLPLIKEKIDDIFDVMEVN